MTELEKYELVNSAESGDSLITIINTIAEEGKIEGKSRSFLALNLTECVNKFLRGEIPARFLTRSYGIRQQAIYIRYSQITGN